MQARFNLLELPEGYKWKPVKGSGSAADPIDLDGDEDMPQVKVEAQQDNLGCPICTGSAGGELCAHCTAASAGGQ